MKSIAWIVFALSMTSCAPAKLTAFCEPGWNLAVYHPEQYEKAPYVKCGVKGEVTLLEVRK